MPHAKGAEDAKVEGRRLRSGFTTDGADGAGAGRKAQGAKRRARGTGRRAGSARRKAGSAECGHPNHEVWFSDGFSYGEQRQN